MKFNSALFYLFFSSVSYLLVNSDSIEYAPIVQLTNGAKVRGIVQLIETGHKVDLYQGVRYGLA